VTSGAPILLRVSYRVRVHEMADFEKIFQQEIIPLIEEHGLRFLGIWKTLVGNVGEFLELWEFDSLSDFEKRWSALLQDPRLQTVFEKTGPMVEEESFSLLQPALRDERQPGQENRYRV
jgi:hypothetical protein